MRTVPDIMLQRSNYKARRRDLPAFYQKTRFAEAVRPASRYRAMECQADDLRNMFSVATKLRLLADETPYEGDQELYREAADALEKRAAWLSGTLPDISYDQLPAQTPALHKPVDLVI